MLISHDQSRKYFCVKCGWTTSGIVLKDKSQDHRWCMKCTSPLLRCNHCFKFTTGTIRVSGVFCDHCNKVVTEDALVVQS